MPIPTALPCCPSEAVTAEVVAAATEATDAVADIAIAEAAAEAELAALVVVDNDEEGGAEELTAVVEAVVDDVGALPELEEKPETPEGCKEEAVGVEAGADPAAVAGLDAELDASLKKPSGSGVGVALDPADVDAGGAAAGVTDAAELTLAGGAGELDTAATVDADDAATGSAAATGTENGGERPSFASASAEAVGIGTPSPRVGSGALGSTCQSSL